MFRICFRILLSINMYVRAISPYCLTARDHLVVRKLLEVIPLIKTGRAEGVIVIRKHAFYV